MIVRVELGDTTGTPLTVTTQAICTSLSSGVTICIMDYSLIPRPHPLLRRVWQGFLMQWFARRSCCHDMVYGEGVCVCVSVPCFW